MAPIVWASDTRYYYNMNTHVDSAVYKWNTSINGITVVRTDYPNLSNVKVYYGQYTTLINECHLYMRGNYDPAQDIGYTMQIPREMEDTTPIDYDYDISGANPMTIPVINIMEARIYLFESDQLDTPNYSQAILHETGHALGWFGHTLDSGDVMYKYNNGANLPSTHDINHLQQLYYYTE